MTKNLRSVFMIMLVCVAAPLQAAPPALTATIRKMTQSVGGAAATTYSAYYRDAQGRARTESGSRVLIQDPVAGAVITLDTIHQIAHVSQATPFAPGNSAAPPPKSPASNGRVLKPYVNNVVNLGTQVIDGNPANGQRHTIEFPPGTEPSIRFARATVERWMSQQLALPLLTKISDSRNGEDDTSYMDIVINPSIDPGLFQVPAGYQVINQGGAPSN